MDCCCVRNVTAIHHSSEDIRAMTSRRSVLPLTTLGVVLLSCCCVGVLSNSAGPPASICDDATQTPGHGQDAQASASPYQVTFVDSITEYDSDDDTVTGVVAIFVFSLVDCRQYIACI